jgi:pimeloyl-ACP methyl ester carboxylesterase
VKLSVRVIGEATGNVDVVLIHGTGSSSEMWRAQVDMLSKHGYRCFLVDLRGHGETHEPEEPTDLKVHVDDVLETLRDAGIRFPAAFLGHSLGALISLNIAQTQPELAHILLLAALPGKVYPPIATAFRMFLKGPFDTIRGRKIHEKMAWRERTLFNTPVYSLSQIVENFDKVDLFADPFTLQCPVHLSAGRFDPVAPIDQIMKMHKFLPGSTLKIYDLAGHNFMDYNTHSFNHWILEKLTSKGSTGEVTVERNL